MLFRSGTSSFDANMAETSTPQPKSKGKGKKKKKKKKDFTKQDGKQIALGLKQGKEKGVRQRKVSPLW